VKFVETIKEKLLTKWFKQWVNDEYDLELLAMTKQLITIREDEINSMISTASRIEIKGFKN
jgi:hypothetical protein